MSSDNRRDAQVAAAATAMDDTIQFNISNDEPMAQDLGQGIDTVEISANAQTSQVRLEFTSIEVGNGNPNDSGTLANQDGGLAVRVTAEDDAGMLTGRPSRFDDEGIRFEAQGDLTFDVRDLVSGVERGDGFKLVVLGTIGADEFREVNNTGPVYLNGGEGNDRLVGGAANDFLVGGAGNDILVGLNGADTFIGGAGDDMIEGGNGDDLVIFDLSNSGQDSANLNDGYDLVSLGSSENAAQIRITFTSSEVGNGNAAQSNTLPGQDGGFGVRVQQENLSGGTSGNIGRFDDEGIIFRSSTGATFDVRDLVSGAERGDFFDAVILGTSESDTFDERTSTDRYYINGGQGRDFLVGGLRADFLVGGAGNDVLNGNNGFDRFIGGAGNDAIVGGEGADRAIMNVTTDGADRVNLGAQLDVVEISADSPTEVRLVFTSSEVGNLDYEDSGTLANQDRGLAVRLQAEDASGNLTGDLSRFDDEGVTFVATSPGVTFDVRDLPTGTQRGNGFQAVTLGLQRNETVNVRDDDRDYYINAGGGDDVIVGGRGDDFLVGGAGDDRLVSGTGFDFLLGGGGADTFEFKGNVQTDTIVDFVSGTDEIDLSFYGITFQDVNIREQGADTLIFVDIDNDGQSEFSLVLQNASAPVQTDFVF